MQPDCSIPALFRHNPCRTFGSRPVNAHGLKLPRTSLRQILVPDNPNPILRCHNQSGGAGPHFPRGTSRSTLHIYVATFTTRYSVNLRHQRFGRLPSWRRRCLVSIPIHSPQFCFYICLACHISHPIRPSPLLKHSLSSLAACWQDVVEI